MLRGYQGTARVGTPGSAPPTYDAQGKVYDVTGNKAYQEGGSYHGKLPLLNPRRCPCPALMTSRVSAVFAGKDASRALAKTSTKPEDVSPEWKDLDDKEKGVLNDWNTFFSKRYNVVGWVAGATNRE